MTTTAAPSTHAPVPVPPPPRAAVWRAVYLRALADKTTIVGVLAVYAFAVAIGVGALWPPMKDTFVSIADDFPAAFDALLGGLSLATPVGWMNAELASIMGPGFLIATAMISAASATAGEEQARTLGLVLSTGVPRTTFLAAKTTAMVTHVLVVGAATVAGMLVANPVGNLGIPTSAVVAAAAQMVLIALVYGALTLLVGAITADKRMSLAIPGLIFAVSFMAATFLGLADSLVWLSKLNLWYPYLANTALADGFHLGFALLMAALAVGLGALAFVAFARRTDLRG
ncbi:ABC transporter permease subunit [Sanguibacter antarcticus]|uniref:ABC-2 family transporter n=1 Tax=Sanguibacter antarcticus TaxID=372484 RepID=A0A2A9E5G3_9MICO|nr:ABC transporter permease subunit [Sanguibacter antarcticus]PFG34198.1 ABC-2 family transporter [Sanguibacter antarcticus]